MRGAAAPAIDDQVTPTCDGCLAYLVAADEPEHRRGCLASGGHIATPQQVLEFPHAQPLDKIVAKISVGAIVLGFALQFISVILY